MIVKMVGAIFIALGSKPAAEAWYDLEFSRETEPVGRDLIWLAHTIIKAKKYHNLPCGSRGRRRLGMKFKGLRARLFVQQNSVWAWSPENQEWQGQEKIEIPAEESGSEQIQPFSAFCSVLAHDGLGGIQTGEGPLPYPVHWFKYSALLSLLTDTAGHSVKSHIWAYCGPEKLTINLHNWEQVRFNISRVSLNLGPVHLLSALGTGLGHSQLRTSVLCPIHRTLVVSFWGRTLLPDLLILGVFTQMSYPQRSSPWPHCLQ